MHHSTMAATITKRPMSTWLTWLHCAPWEICTSPLILLLARISSTPAIQYVPQHVSLRDEENNMGYVSMGLKSNYDLLCVIQMDSYSINTWI